MIRLSSLCIDDIGDTVYTSNIGCNSIHLLHVYFSDILSLILK